jgi:FkbM family methyltransferase
MLATKHKVAIARRLSAIVIGMRRCCHLSAKTTVVRRGLTWELDLEEGIDLSIYLLGGFELRVLRKYRELVRPGDVVIDIGANIGAHTLPLSVLVGGTGRVLACEPTRYAYVKLRANIAANPHLAARITAHQTMLSSRGADRLPDAIYSSWPMTSVENLHELHQGRLMSTRGAAVSTLDELVSSQRLSQIALIKLDVDGHEYEVLQGGQDTFRRLKPTLLVELAPYVHKDNQERFDSMLCLLWEAGYRLSDVATGKLLPRDIGEIRRRIPPYAGISAIGTAA